LLLASGVTSCSTPAQEFAELPVHADQILWLPENASMEPAVFHQISINNGRNVYADGSASVAFVLTDERDELSRSIIQHYANTPWRQRPIQYLNPGLVTSFNDGWRHRCGCVVQSDEAGNPIPREPYYEWHGEWQDAHGNIITYDLSAEGQQLRGYAAFVPKRIVDVTQRSPSQSKSRAPRARRHVTRAAFSTPPAAAARRFASRPALTIRLGTPYSVETPSRQSD
jgi:hypothetical protein